MKDLDLICDFTKSDSATFSKADDGNLIIEAGESCGMAIVIYKKEKVKQLRDWLNEFLGESK